MDNKNTNMEDIELIIKIPKDLYETYKGRPPMLGDAGMDMIAQSIANGTPLPPGHGDLIAEIDKLPRIKVGNSNSPTVKYCIDERLLYEMLEKMKEVQEPEQEEQEEKEL